MATVAITGANSGIGLRAAHLLAEEGHRVLALCRSVDRATAVLGPGIEVIETHMDNLSSIETAAAKVADAGVDALINNAATFDLGMKQRKTTAGGHEYVWATNHLGPAALAARLGPALAASPGGGRAVFIASKGLIAMPRIRIRWDDLDAQSWYTPTKAYYHSKLAQVMLAEHLAERWAPRVAVTCLRVPAVRLDAAKLAAQPRLQQWLYAPKNRAAVAPEAVARTYVELATGPAPASAYVDESGAPCALPRFARNEEERKRLAEVTEAATGVRFDLD